MDGADYWLAARNRRAPSTIRDGALIAVEMSYDILRPAAWMRSATPPLRLLDLRVVGLPGEAHRLGKVVGAPRVSVDAFDSQDGVQVLEGFSRLELALDQHLPIGQSHELRCARLLATPKPRPFLPWRFFSRILFFLTLTICSSSSVCLCAQP